LFQTLIGRLRTNFEYRVLQVFIQAAGRAGLDGSVDCFEVE